MRNPTSTLGAAAGLLLLLSACPGNPPAGADAGAGCPPGTLGCPCATGNKCDGLLACVSGTCASTKAATVSVGNPSVRSCDLLLTENGRQVVGASFSAGAAGEFLKRGAKAAVSFTMKSDAAPGGTAVAVGLAGDDAPTVAPPTVTSATCYDRSGQPVADPQVTVP